MIGLVNGPVSPPPRRAGFRPWARLRLERAVAIARHVEVKRPFLGQHGFGIGAVAMIAVAACGYNPNAAHIRRIVV